MVMPRPPRGWRPVVEVRLGVGVEGVVQLVVCGQRIDLGQRGRRLAHVELAGDHVGDQAGAVFAQEFDSRPISCQCHIQIAGILTE